MESHNGGIIPSYCDCCICSLLLGLGQRWASLAVVGLLPKCFRTVIGEIKCSGPTMVNRSVQSNRVVWLSSGQLAKPEPKYGIPLSNRYLHSTLELWNGRIARLVEDT